MRRRLLLIPIALIACLNGRAIGQSNAAPPAPPAASQPAASQPAASSSDPNASVTHVDPTTQPDRVPTGLLTPIPSTGIPAIYNKMYDLTADELSVRAKSRDYLLQINKIKFKHFGNIKVEAIRQQGIDLLKEFTDPAAFKPMIEALARESDDVRLAMLDHFARQGEEGQAALGWVAIFDKDQAIRNEALKRMVAPAGEPVKYLLNSALRAKDHDVVCAAATIAGALNITSTIPLLIFAQASSNGGSTQPPGDLAWIAIQTQQAYVQNLVPVVGAGSGGFQPVIGIVTSGVVLRVVDAFVIEYLTPVHSALVAMTTDDWGNSTEYLSYNIQAWWDWFNNEYVPFKNQQAELSTLSGK